MAGSKTIKGLSILVLGTALISSTQSCDGKKGDEGKQNRSSAEGDLPYGKLVLSADALSNSTLRLAADTSPTACTMYGDQITPANGTCLTPLALGGFASSLEFGAKEQDPHLRGGARMFSADERTVKPGQIFSGGIFDITNPSKSLVGNNTLAGPTSDQTPSHRTEPHVVWSNAQINLLYLKYQVLLKNSYVTVLLPSYAQPYADDTSLSKCSSQPSDTILGQSRYSDTALLKDMTFRNGDYLFCVKDTAEAECAASDFKWLDLDSMTLVSTRPSKPRQAAAFKEIPDCSLFTGPGLQGDERGGFELGYGTVSLMAKFKQGQTFKLFGEFTHGPLSEQWKDATAPFGKDTEDRYQNLSPWVYYTYTPQSAATQNGGNLEVKLDFDVTGMVFLDMDIDDLETSSLEQQLKVIDTRSTWIHDQVAVNKLNSAGILENLPIMEVTPTVTISGGDDVPTSFEELFTSSGQTDQNADQ
jgi:hypothetical protein